MSSRTRVHHILVKAMGRVAARLTPKILAGIVGAERRVDEGSAVLRERFERILPSRYSAGAASAGAR